MKALILLSALTMLAGCSNHSQWNSADANECSLPVSKSLGVLVNGARTKFADLNCHYQYRNYHQQLLSAAKGDPSKDNRRWFTDFYQAAVDNGVISKQDGRKQFTHYFTTSFADVLPNDRSTCSMENDKDRLFKDLKREVEDKRAGLLGALGDQQAWFMAGKKYEDLVFVLQTTMVSCDDHGHY